MRYFPAFHDLSTRPSLLVGGGEMAARKLRLLLKAGAQVTVVAPAAGPEIAGLAERGEVSWQARPFQANDVTGCGLVISATGQPAVDEAVAAAAQAAGLPVSPELATAASIPVLALVIWLGMRRLRRHLEREDGTKD